MQTGFPLEVFELIYVQSVNDNNGFNNYNQPQRKIKWWNEMGHHMTFIKVKRRKECLNIAFQETVVIFIVRNDREFK